MGQNLIFEKLLIYDFHNWEKIFKSAKNQEVYGPQSPERLSSHHLGHF